LLAIHTVRDNALLHVIAVILSLLLLAGVFGSDMDSSDNTPGTPADNSGGAPDSVASTNFPGAAADQPCEAGISNTWRK
jgi:hypothetical protein